MYPTHVSSRGEKLLNDGKLWIQMGGVVDFTADADGEVETEAALLGYKLGQFVIILKIWAI